MRIRPYQRLVVWQEAHQLCKRIYSLTKKFPLDERFGLISQMQRSSYSVPTNIAEGNSKRSAKEQNHFLEISLCSLEELHYQCLLSYELHYITQQESVEMDDRIQRTGYLLGKLRASLC